MVRHTILFAVVLGLWLGTFPSVGTGGPSKETVPEPTAATPEAIIDANETAGPPAENTSLVTAGQEKPGPDAEDSSQPATVTRVAFDPNTDPNLVAWWKLDGDATDSSGNGLDGTPVGDPAWVQGRIGGAMQLDGADDCIDCGNSPWLAIRDRLTVACWIKVEAFTRGYETILAKGDSSYRLSRAFGRSRTPHFACAGTEPEPSWLNGRTILTDNRWHHIAGVYDGASMTLYVDGREDARKPASGQLADTEYALCIGENAEAPERFLKGLVDDVRIYSRALGPEEIETLVGPYAEAQTGEDQKAASPQAPGVQPRTPKGHTLALLVATAMAVLAAILMVSGAAVARHKQARQEKHVWQILRKEIMLNLMTFKFAVATVVCVVLTAVFVPMLASDYQQRVGAYRDNATRNEADLRTVMVYKNLAPTVFRPPSALSVFSEGLEKRIADAVTVELNEVPQMRGVATEGNPYQSVFPVFDTALIFKVVLSILALLVAYDAVSGERERGTLKQMLSGAMRRNQVLLAKFLAGLLVLVVPVTIVFVVGLVILLSFPLISLSASDWARIALMYVASLIFISVMYNLGLLFSCLTRRSAISLVLGLFAWILFAVVVPNGSVYLAAELRPPEPREKIDARIALLQLEYEIERDENAPSRSSGLGARSDASDAFGRGYHRLLDRGYLEYLQERNRLQFPLAIKYADRFWEAERSYVRSLHEQGRLADRLARISPIAVYDGTMSALAGTDLAGFQNFVDAVRVYRAQIVEYVRSETDNFSSSRFFTPCTKKEADEYDIFIEQARRLKSQEEMAALYEAAKVRWEKVFAETPGLDLRDFPVFRMPGVFGDVGRAVPGLALLVFVSTLFFALSLVAFMRYDVR